MDANKLTGVGLLLYFVGMIVYSYMTDDFEFNMKTYAQLGIAGVGSFYLLGYKNLNNIKGLFNKLFKGKETMATTDLDEKDFDALVYLKQRALDMNSQKAFDLVVELNNLLFMGGGIKEDEGEKKDETTKE